jgi:hypothetical protein
MVEPTEDRTCHHSQMLWNAVPVCLQRHRQPWRWLRDAWTQGYMRATCVVVWHPLVQEIPQVVLSERDQKVQAFPPERAQETFADGVGLGTPHRGLEYPQPQVAYALIELL